MLSLSGQCLGGPWGGKMLAHTARTKELFQCVPLHELPGHENPVAKLGEYRWGQFGHWHWAPVENADNLLGVS